jgi:rRNA-processing protein FCF1
MVVRVLFVLGCLILGSAVAATHRFVPPIAGLSSWFSSALVGAPVGAAVAGVLLVVWCRLTRAMKNPAFATRLFHCALGGSFGAVLGCALSFSLGRLFPPASGVYVAQGCLVGGCSLLGLGVGFAIASPFWQGPPAENGRQRAANDRQSLGMSKVLDTSVIIDGRIGDLMATGFIEGEVLIPEFVLDELQGIADSADSLRRRKGRRGLEILHQLMENHRVAIRVVTRDYPSIAEVDRKLIRLAKDENAVLMTTDYNLNRVAQVEGIGILNVNELAKALKPRFVPGEQIDVEIIDRGAEINQGVGYLDDGTMIVVENGRRHVGRTIRATVKSTLQTDAGRMLFAEPANEVPRWEKEREAR